ncbi:MAG TPA: PEP/pyruvate-binding domain-containing protein [Acidimicrobiales bacterium]
MISNISTVAFDDDLDIDSSDLTALLGGKASGLVRMTKQGIPVPPGFVVPTTVCHQIAETGWPPRLGAAISRALDRLEASIGRRLGDPSGPLLVSVRSGAPVSMPGMMDTVLNVGMTPAVAEGLATATGDAAFAADTQRRASESYRSVVGAAAPADPLEQVLGAVRAVFASWSSDRAVAYREREGIPHDLGTAATVQMMVFGNLGDDSGTGVAFSRDPATGAPGLMGDLLQSAQGEDVVAGTHATLPLSALAAQWPAVWTQLCATAEILEHDLDDMVDIEFTIERGHLWILQCRRGKRSARATFRIAVDLANDPSFDLDRVGAVERCRMLLDDPPTGPASETDDATVVGSGLAASPGRASGMLCLDVAAAVALEAAGGRPVLARQETSPADVAGMSASVGLITTLGGLVSHAAVVARSWGIPAVVGAHELRIIDRTLVGPGGVLAEGEIVTVDGDSGQVLLGDVAGHGTPLPEVETIRTWAADSPTEGRREAGGGAASSGFAEGPGAHDVLRVIGLKAMTTLDALVEIFDAHATFLSGHLEVLIAEGLVEPMPGDRHRISEIGAVKVTEMFAEESAVAAHHVDPLLDDFHPVNLVFKEVVTAWQLKPVAGEQLPNDHTDEVYDKAIIERVATEVHPNVTDVVHRASEAVPRLGHFVSRFQTALDRLSGGDQRYLAHPLLDSYHTIWFELHEELIRLAGRDRRSEAESGRA